ncbi:YczE/YyaS/YitT family protein [Streptococcus dentapri]|uniref:YitT family protein n=1 Tax=Streptococcus dentapri TaxID=573564 RepID=A0ABV8D0L6_9STRE
MLKRLVVFCFGVIILAFGIVVNTKTALGVSSISSLPYVLSRTSSLTLGQATMAMYIIYIVSQAILLKKLTLKMILQIPFSFLFGGIVDFFDQLLHIVPSNVFWSLFSLALAIIVTAFGAYLVVTMDLVFNPPDGIVNTLAQVLNREFGQAKLFFDCSVVTLSLIISWVFSHHLLGFGIGTVASALFIGRMISVFNKLLDKHVKLIGQNSQKST